MKSKQVGSITCLTNTISFIHPRLLSCTQNCWKSLTLLSELFFECVVTLFISFSSQTGRRRSIGKIPDEVLSDIFLLCLPPSDTPEYDESVVFISPSDGSLPFTLLFVCKRWRYVALDTSHLWRNVKAPSLGFDLSAFSARAMSNQLKSLHQWLSFSKQLPLSIKFISPSQEFLSSCNCQLYHYAPFLDGNSDPNRHAWNVLLGIMQEENRWTRFNVVFDHSILHKFLSSTQFQQSSGLATYLTHLEVSFEGLFTMVDIANLERLYAWIKKLPALRSLVLREDRLLGAKWLFKDLSALPFGTTPKIEFHRFDMSAKDGAHALSLCASAEDVYLVGKNAFSNPLQYDGMMHIRSPRTFANMSRLCLIGIQFPTSLLSRSTFPFLEHLEIYSCMESSHVLTHVEFSQFLHFSTKLKTVIIHSRRMSVRDTFSLLCIPALQLVPCVDLHFDMCSSTDQVKVIMTDLAYQWFRDGPNFIVWRYDTNHTGNNFGWKLLDEDEILVWELKNGIAHHHM